ncbi:MAG: ATP-dependent helicase, partial [Smithella sp.]
INYDMPDTTDAYTHRIGRTGRAAKTGDAFTFVTSQDVDLAHSLKRVLGAKLEYSSVDGLTITMPTIQVNDRTSRSGSGRGQGNNGSSFSPKARNSSRPAQRSFTQANRHLWAN